MLGFSCTGSADRNYPLIGESEEKILSRFVELYSSRENILDRLLRVAHKKLSFSEESVRFWAKTLVEGRFGPLEPLLGENLEEIMVNGIGEPVFVYDREKGMQKTNIELKSPEYFIEISNRLLSSLGRRVNQSNPRETGVLPSGDRVSIIIPPYSKSHILSIRKYSVEPFTVPQLVEKKMLSPEAAAFLWMVMETGNINLGVVGNTGSGKTTLLNALLRFVPKHSRIILVEDIPEISTPQDQVVGLVSNKALDLSMRDAILDSLRLRPDRVIIGEVRSDGDVSALRESCLAGHAMGTYFTYHAESVSSAYRRLINQGFPEYDLSVIPLVVTCRRYERGGQLFRRVVEVGDVFKLGRVIESKLKRLNYLSLAFSDMTSEITERAKFIVECSDLSDTDLFKEIQRWSSDI